MKFYAISIATLAFCLSLNAEDESKSEYFIAPDGAKYAHAGAIHISKEDIRKLPAISFPENPLTISPQDAVKSAFREFAGRFPNAKTPEFVECRLLKFPQDIAKDKYFYQISLAPNQVEEETTDGSILIFERLYTVVVPLGRKSVYVPALSVKPKG